MHRPHPGILRSAQMLAGRLAISNYCRKGSIPCLSSIMKKAKVAATMITAITVNTTFHTIFFQVAIVE